MRVCVSARSFAVENRAAMDLLERQGFSVLLNPHGRRLGPAESIEFLKGATGVIAGTEMLGEEVFSRTPALRVISRLGTGLDNVDLEAARRRGIQVFSTPEAPVLAVAELTVCSLLALLRRLPEMDSAVRRGEWSAPLGRQLSGMTVGIVGLGRIGREVARLLAPFRCRLLAHDPAVQEEAAQALGARQAGLEILLRESDVVTLHLPLDSSTRGLLGASRLSLMKRGAYLLNMSRGGLIDEGALLEALESGALAGAALDAFAEEPYRGSLTRLSNVLLTPHAGSATAEARCRMELEAAQNLLRGLGRMT